MKLHLNSGVRLLFELHCVVVIKLADTFAMCAKVTMAEMAFTFTRLPLNFYTSVSGCVCGFGLNKNIDGSTDLAKKRHGMDWQICRPLFILLFQETVVRKLKKMEGE